MKGVEERNELYEKRERERESRAFRASGCFVVDGDEILLCATVFIERCGLVIFFARVVLVFVVRGGLWSLEIVDDDKNIWLCFSFSKSMLLAHEACF